MAKQPKKAARRAVAPAKKGSTIADRAKALPPGSDQIQPDMPVKTALLEAERLRAAGMKLRPQLLGLPGFDVADLDDLPALIKEVDGAELAWQRVRLGARASSRTDARAEAEKLRGDLMAAGRYLLRKDPAAQADLDVIAEGDGLADLVSDLRALAGFARAHAREWAAAPLPAGATERAVELASTLEAAKDNDAALAAQGKRNSAFLILAHAVEEVRAAARFLLRAEPRRLAPFLSQYGAAKARKRRTADKQPAPAPAEGGKAPA